MIDLIILCSVAGLVIGCLIGLCFGKPKRQITYFDKTIIANYYFPTIARLEGEGVRTRESGLETLQQCQVEAGTLVESPYTFPHYAVFSD